MWINGRHIPSSKITTISSKITKLDHTINSTKNFFITKFDTIYDPINDSSLFSIPSIWDNIISNFTESQLRTIFDISTANIVNIEDDTFNDYIDYETLMREVVRRKYMINMMVDPTNPYAYGYEDIDRRIPRPVDSGSDYIFESGDSNTINNIDGIERELYNDHDPRDDPGYDEVFDKVAHVTLGGNTNAI